MTYKSLKMTLLIALSSIAYTTKSGVSPVYFITPLLFLYSICIYKITIKKNELFIAICGLLFLSSTSINFAMTYGGYGFTDYSLPIFINIYVSLLTGIAIALSSRKLDAIGIRKVVNIFIGFVIAFSSLDTLWKLFNPKNFEFSMSQYEDIWFYTYKNSFMFGDSNVLGLLLLYTLGLSLYLRVIFKTRSNYHFNEIAILILIAATLSRSAMFAALVGMIIYTYIRLKKFRIYFVPIIVILLIYLSASLYEMLANDGSGETKLNELANVYSYLNMSSSNLMVGIGYGYGESATGRYIHGLFAKLIMEGGLLSFISFIAAILGVWVNDIRLVVIIAPFLISSFSLSAYVITPFFVTIMFLAFKLSEFGNVGRSRLGRC